MEGYLIQQAVTSIFVFSIRDAAGIHVVIPLVIGIIHIVTQRIFHVIQIPRIDFG